MVSRWHIFGGMAVVLAAMVGNLTGGLFVLQLLILTALVAYVGIDSLLKADESEYLEEGQPVLRSRVTHYAQIARVEDSGPLIRTASNPFERELLHRPRWSRLSVRELRGLAARVSEEWEEPRPGAESATR